MNVTIKLSDGDSQRLTVACTVQSMMLTNHLSFCDEAEQIDLDLQLTSAEWRMYSDFVIAIAKLEKDTGKKFIANQEFAVEFFKDYSQEDLDTMARIERYLICQVLRDSLDLYIGSLFKGLDRDTVLKAYGITETEEEKKRSVNTARKIAHEKMLEKAYEIIPELEQYHITLYD